MNTLLESYLSTIVSEEGYGSFDEYIEDNPGGEEVKKIIEEYAEIYHAEKIKEVGDCFNQKWIDGFFYKNSNRIDMSDEVVLNDLNTRAAEWAAGKVEEIKAQKTTYQINFGNDLRVEISFSFNSVEVVRAVNGWGNTVDLKYIIINQIKNK
ncbi:MAG TPA: hypothetical protein VHA52_04945 [Candidatus Babeliaceae bacterium]|nr:hypothetical protein [Candidatus Babeliaceae bacterium]